MYLENITSFKHKGEWENSRKFVWNEFIRATLITLPAFSAPVTDKLQE